MIDKVWKVEVVSWTIIDDVIEEVIVGAVDGVSVAHVHIFSANLEKLWDVEQDGKDHHRGDVISEKELSDIG